MKPQPMASLWQELGLSVMVVTDPCSTLLAPTMSKRLRSLSNLFFAIFFPPFFKSLKFRMLMILVLMKGLDFVIAEARRYGIKLILSLANNYDSFGGKKQYVNWARSQGQYLTSDDDFFRNPVVKGYYKNHIRVWKCTHFFHFLSQP
jgi:hypothetical protein